MKILRPKEFIVNYDVLLYKIINKYAPSDCCIEKLF